MGEMCIAPFTMIVIYDCGLNQFGVNISNHLCIPYTKFWVSDSIVETL